MNLVEKTRQGCARPQAVGASNLPAVDIEEKIGAVIRIEDVAFLGVSKYIRDVPRQNCPLDGKRTAKPENEAGFFLPQNQIREPVRSRDGCDVSIASARLRRGANYVEGELICFPDA